jgi:hypothetical protein
MPIRPTQRVKQDWKRFTRKAYERMNSDFLGGYDTLSEEEQLQQLSQKNLVHFSRERLRFKPNAHLHYFRMNGTRLRWRDLTPAQRERFAQMIISGINTTRNLSQFMVLSSLRLHRKLFMKMKELIDVRMRKTPLHSTQYTNEMDRFYHYQNGIRVINVLIRQIERGKRDWITGRRT